MLTTALIKAFIKDPQQTRREDVRTAYGKLAGITGLCANFLLFAAKLVAGFLSGSLAIVADAFNNFSDAGSSVVTLIGFKLSSAPPDKEHPFGHGRIEYLSALGVAVLIMLAGFELATSAIDKILHPQPADTQPVSLIILAAAILVKLWMALFYRNIGRRIDSQVLRASATDSRNDVICTSVVLLTSFLSLFFHINIDGYVGAAVALFVIWSGFSIIRETLSPLLGQAPDPQTVEEIKQTVLSYDGIIGVHDLMVHNYGPGRCVISLHAEVPCHEDLLHSHDIIDCAERELMEKFHAVSCIHMDPVDTDDTRIASLQALVASVLDSMDMELKMHDFRVVFGQTHTNLVFDLVIPFDSKIDAKALVADIERRVRQSDPTLYVVATVEHAFS